MEFFTIAEFLMMPNANKFIPTYKHLNRNLYLFPNFIKLNEKRRGKYVISETPWKPLKDCLASSQTKSQLEITVEHITEVTLETMGQRYCFTQGKVIEMREHYFNYTNCRSDATKKISQFTIEQLSKQCGLTYRHTV